MLSLKSKLWRPLVFLVYLQRRQGRISEKKKKKKRRERWAKKREREANNDDSSLKEDQVVPVRMVKPRTWKH